MMKLLRRLFVGLHKTAAAGVEALNETVNEDAGYNDHLVGQTRAPFYCGTAFCGHSTKKAARECWKRKLEAFEAILKAGGNPYDDERLYPERNPANWPINRSSSAMRAEYIERAKMESKKVRKS